MITTPSRRRVAGVSTTLGAVLVGMSFLASPAQAGEPAPPPREYTSGYDTYLKASQLNTSAEDAPNGTCPSDESVDDLNAWHFVLDGSDHDFASLDVTFSTGEYAGLTPVSLPEDEANEAAFWASFDPTANFIAEPSGKHAYVYAGGDADDTVVDAAAQTDPEAGAPADFQLSHTCAVGDTGGDDGGDVGADDQGDDGATDDTDETTDDTDETTDDTDETTDDTDETTDDTDETTDDTDDGTDDVLGSDSVNPTTSGGADDGATDDEVKGNVVLPDQLPRTGENDRSLFVIGMGLITIGAIAMIARRELFVRS